MILGDAVSKLETFVWILNPISRSITWCLFILKASYLVIWFKIHTNVSNFEMASPKIIYTWSNDQPQHDLSRGGASLSIS